MSGIFNLAVTLGILADFWLAILGEIAVIVYVVKTRDDRRRLGPLGRRLAARSMDTSGFWCLPFYLWAWQANLLVIELFSDRETLDDTRRIYDDMETIFISLFYLLVLRTAGAAITRDAPATLGLTGHPRTAAGAALLSVFLSLALFFWYL